MTIEAVETAWAQVWESSDVWDITGAVLLYEFTEESASEQSLLFHNQKINFFEAITNRNVVSEEIGGIKTAKYTVSVRYTIEADTQGRNYREVVRVLNDLRRIVDSVIGVHWDNSIDFSLGNYELSPIFEAVIAGRKCFRGITEFIGFKAEI